MDPSNLIIEALIGFLLNHIEDIISEFAGALFVKSDYLVTQSGTVALYKLFSAS